MCLSVIHGRNATAYSSERLAGLSGSGGGGGENGGDGSRRSGSDTPSPKGRLEHVGSYGISTPTNRCHSVSVKLRQTFSHTISLSVSVRAIQMRMVPSLLPEARRAPSGLNATEETGCLLA